MKLARLRLKNEVCNEKIKKIKIESKKIDTNNKNYCVSYIVDFYSWNPQRLNLLFTKFYPNEFFYMLTKIEL